MGSKKTIGMKLVLSTLKVVVVMLVAIVHAEPQVKDEVAKRQQQFLPPKALFMDYEEVEDEDEVAKRQQQFLPPKGQGQKMFYDVQDEEAKRQQQFLLPTPTLLSEKRGKAEVGLGMSDEVKDEEAKRQQQPILDLLKNKFNLLKNKLKNKLDQ